ncbi:MAG: 16S rRNA (cytosine(1402)-N(4))-methyltransferase RsmH [Desulfobacterales bacterium]|nr:16S rRNA (cytosine(1402)-N(4))-methyltransferase RsmH [Desulfobacterales bacterium]
MAYRHISVMREEVLAHLNCSPGKVVVDGTLGGCGHAGAILDRIVPGGLLIGIDQDPEAIRHAEAMFKDRRDNVRLFHDNFANLPAILSKLAISGVDGILLDLGLSLYQLEESGRGFSFRREEPLDMRMDTESKTMAADLIQQADEKELARIFREYGEERWANRIARAVVRRRKKRPIATAKDLSQIVVGAIPKAGAGGRIHPATRVFMALRIAVNQELERLEAIMDTVPELLNAGGRLCVLSFHSLEDRIVKHRLKQHAAGCICPPGLPVCTCNHHPTLRILTRKAETPSQGEVRANPMARSTRLRAAERL